MLIHLQRSNLSIFELSCGLVFIFFISLYNNAYAAGDFAYSRYGATPAGIKNNNSRTRQHYLKPVLHKGVLLVAAENLIDPNFGRTVILITKLNKKGTAGLVLNRRTRIPIARALPRILQIIPVPDYLYNGGPVSPDSVNLMVISETPLPKANNIFDKIYLVDTLELFNEIIAKQIDTKFIRLYSGSAGWAPGQLESELMRGDWYLWHASEDIIFNNSPDTIWKELIQIVTAKWVMN